ncbi:unnamed protein product [Cochlearia groenlandica]
MVSKEDVDFYCEFSRKELQSLCKKYNLPANRSSTDMAESLASYFEKNSMNSVAFGVTGNQGSSSAATTSREPVSRPWNVKRDSYGNELDNSRRLSFQGTVPREPGFILGGSTQYQEQNGALIDSGSAPPYPRLLNEKSTTDPQLENRSKEVDNGDSPSSSSFEFHVSSENGISLSVDLNFNPSDWINSMRNEINVFDSMDRRITDIDNATKCKKPKVSGQDKVGDVRRESSLSPAIIDNTQVLTDFQTNGEQSLASSTIQPSSKHKEGLDTCNGENGLKVSIPDSSGPGQIISSCVESCSKSCCVNPVDLSCVNASGKKSKSDSIMVASEQNHQAEDLLIEIQENPSTESFQKVGNSSTVMCPERAGSELSTSEVEACQPLCSPRKTSGSSNISSSEHIIDRESTSYPESLKFHYNGGMNCLPPNTEPQEKSEVISEQARSDRLD